MKKKETHLALCDPEEEYLQHLADFLRKQKAVHWTVHTFSGVDELLRAGIGGFDFFAISESIFGDSLCDIDTGRMVILNESGFMPWEGMAYVDKYAPAGEVFKGILQYYAEVAENDMPRLNGNAETKFIGFFTPVHRSLQTSFSLTMSKVLAKEHTVLYLNFESFAGIGYLLPDLQTMDLADLMYFVNAGQDKLRMRLQIIRQKLGNLDYIPPMKAGQNLVNITCQEWLQLFRRIEELGEYEYVVLDLSEAMQGIFDILRMCSKVFTLVKEDGLAAGKIMQYEQLLQKSNYEDVLQHTEKLNLPIIRNISEEPEMLTRGELAGYVERLLEDGQWNT